MSQIEIIEKKIRELNADDLVKIDHLVDSLLNKNVYDKSHWVFAKQNWAGALKEFRDQYTSIELQKKSLDWWTDVSR